MSKKRVIIACVALVLIFLLIALTTKKKPSEPEPIVQKTTPVVVAEVPEKEDVIVYTSRTFTAMSPSNWNILTYQNDNDRQVMQYINSPLFEFDFRFDENGKIIDGAYKVKMSALTSVVDISATLANNPEYNIAKGETGRAYKFTLRDDLTWDDGTKITAEDFVYSMQEQLNPLFQNHRADKYYNGAAIIHNARNYLKQGQIIDFDNGEAGTYSMNDLIKTNDGTYVTPNNGKVYIAVDYPLYWAQQSGVNTLADCARAFASFLDLTAWPKLKSLENEEGLVELTDETYSLLSSITTNNPAWNETEADLPKYFVVKSETYPEMSFSKVGIFVGDNELELIIVLDKSLQIFDSKGNLNYHAAYDIAELPLVKQDLYEACKVEPIEGSNIWTTKYNTSLETSASWGPYKLSEYKSGESYALVRNKNWYGYKANLYPGLYQADKISCETVSDYNTAWLKFLAGELDTIGLDVTLTSEYKDSERAFFIPSDFVLSLQLQSSYEALKARELQNENKTILTYPEFRNAISLGIDRADYTKKCTTASLPGYGLFTDTMHYYDVENGKLYRDTEEAKQALCNTYKIDDVETITGYNIELARDLLEKAYQKALKDKEISENDRVILTYGASVDSDATRRIFEFLRKAIVNIAVGTSLEGRLDLEFAAFGQNWAYYFREGYYDICNGGVSGAAWDPGYLLNAFLSPENMFSKAWDTTKELMTFTAIDANGHSVEDTLSLLDWWNCLNGVAGAKYNMSRSVISEEERLPLIAALEEAILTHYYTIPLAYSNAASLMGYKCDYVTFTYNTFMEFGGIKYMKFNYTDEEWERFINRQNGQLSYK